MARPLSKALLRLIEAAVYSPTGRVEADTTRGKVALQRLEFDGFGRCFDLGQGVMVFEANDKGRHVLRSAYARAAGMVA